MLRQRVVRVRDIQGFMRCFAVMGFTYGVALRVYVYRHACFASAEAISICVPNQPQ